MTKPKAGQAARVLIYDSASAMSKWHPCKITGFTAADDRDYRVNVVLESGAELRECAPECVRVK